jgi:hypothetical protein
VSRAAPTARFLPAALAALAALALQLLVPGGLPAAGPALSTLSTLSTDEGYGLLRRMLSETAAERRAAARRLIEAGDASLVPGLVDVLFFLPRNRRAEALSALAALTGERPGERYHDWVDLLSRREDLKAKEGYVGFKAELFSRIDPRYRQILDPGAPVRLRLEEVVFGGVPVEGIPALDRPAHVPAAEAKYLAGSERVFGVSAGGAQRAYPLRILDWHEMLNDVVGGEPVTLSYCTLCGSGVLYATRNPSGEPHTFGTSGLLYRSNKLMLDRQTLTLWNNLTGEPAVGRLARDPAPLPVLPLTVTTWDEWRARHPETTVLALDTALGRRWGFDYQPGAADRRRAGVSFPAGPKSGALDPKAEVYAVRLGGLAKAYAIERVLAEKVVNDRLGGPGGESLVVVGDPASGAVRAYRRGELRFEPGAGPRELIDEAGRLWTVGEDALLPHGDGAPAALPRVPGHQAFWFGWFSFFPRSELYGGAPR